MTKSQTNKALQLYFTEFDCSLKGRPLTTLATVINKDLSQTEPSETIKKKDDLDQLGRVAQDQ